jgi:hypothetical protein
MGWEKVHVYQVLGTGALLDPLRILSATNESTDLLVAVLKTDNVPLQPFAESLVN